MKQHSKLTMKEGFLRRHVQGRGNTKMNLAKSIMNSMNFARSINAIRAFTSLESVV